MRKFKYLPLALAALMLGACSSDDVIVQGDKDTPGFNAQGTGYLKLEIALPQQAATATRANDATDDGSAEEYAVNNATLILFKGTDATSATFAAAYNMTGFSTENGLDNDQITTQVSKIQRINSFTGGESDTDKIYALVVLNHNGLLTVDDQTTAMSVNGASFSGTLKDFTEKTVSSETSFTGDGFFMTNAVVTNKPGKTDEISGATTTILADVSKNIWPSEEEAQSNPAADIFVERGVAKVEVTATNGYNVTVDDSEGTEQTLGWSMDSWALANQNTSSYLVRNWNQSVEGITMFGDAWYALASDGADFAGSESQAFKDNPHRFAGIQLIKETEAEEAVPGVPENPVGDYYRTYWGIDPNYNVDNPGFTDAPADADGMPFDSDIKYCLENTFDIAHQNVRNTTCVIVKGKITLPEDWGGDDFYTISNNRNVIYNLTNAENAIKGRATDLYGDAIVDRATTDFKADGLNDGKVTVTATDVEFTVDNVGAEATNNLQYTEVKFTATYTPNAGGEPTTKEYTLTSAGGELAELQRLMTVTEYTDAVSYYPVLIKHFGDDLTPWTSVGKEGNPYPSETVSAEDNWLGRYGVLRNNWYNIEVNSVSGIGSATVPNVNKDLTPDDNLFSYISCKINVLSWAKRTQSVDL